MDIKFAEFETDDEVVAKTIYGRQAHSTTNLGVVLSAAIKEELCSFLAGYNQWVNTTESPYYRIDAYFDHESLSILEINASFVDGWGTALNLARANKIEVDEKALDFPVCFASEDPVYLPELRLLLTELEARGQSGNTLLDYFDGSAKTYVYGRVGDKNPMIAPYDGLRLDNKFNLAEFSEIWKGRLIKVPTHYTCENATWDEIPQDAVLKFCDKSSEECQRARRSVLIGKPNGKAPFLRKNYEARKLIAQDKVNPMRHETSNCQLVILAIGSLPITGYVQYSRSQIINDDSIHGPLKIE